MVDSSVALNWVMPDEDRALTEDLMDIVATTGAVVPALFRIEVGNSLLMGARRKRIEDGYIHEALDLIGQLPLRVDKSGADYIWDTTIDLAAAYGLTLYDATYLESAIRLELPLATLDAGLARAAKLAGVPSPWPQQHV
ncbi:type II toxin-antitoxin system VapC family toxin [Mesorhizobium sp. J428]|uniref:type II toxin-antitoxin system VapC family toxin n=1 Tax=Mesorhizobium sp. J428 TaxID=2898440 RepID=UPI002151D363|nr:type II toxin-antitoxin system VapC family toxin [Mesorhizobium sp. J428]